MPSKSKTQQLAHRLNTALHKAKVKRKYCLHPNAPDDCSGNIVRAHTVQKSLLKKIAHKKHVYALDFDLTSQQSPITMVKRGVNRASTFTGYCSFHDNELFRPIEDDHLQLIQQHMALLTYRTLSMELYKKRTMSELQQEGLDINGESDIEAAIQTCYDMLEPANQLALLDIKVLHDMGKAIIEDDFSDFNYYAIELDRKPDIVASGGSTLVCDIYGIAIQELESPEPLDLIAFNLLPHRTKYGIAVFSWHGKSESNEKFIRSFHSIADADKPNLLVSFVLHNIENTFAAPRWWDSLPNDEKRKLLSKMYFSVAWFTPANHPIAYDSTQYVDWKVTDTKTNITL